MKSLVNNWFALLLANKVFAVFLAEPIADFLAVAITVIAFVARTKKILVNE